MSRMLIVGGLLVAGLMFAVAAFAATIVVQPQVPQGWYFQTVGGTASGGYQNGPGSPPLGTGSLRLTVGALGDDFVALRNINYNGVPLSSLTSLSYDTYIQAHNGCVAPYLMLSVDIDGDGVFNPSGLDDALFFEPCYQNGTYITSPPGQTILPQNGGGPNPTTVGGWQHWEALTSAGWWSANYGGAGGPPLTTIAQYILDHPGAKIVNTDACLGGVRIRAGAGAPVWNNFDGNVDNFTIGVSGNNTTYNFENGPLPIATCTPPLPPTPVPVRLVGGTGSFVDDSTGASAAQDGTAPAGGSSPLSTPGVALAVGAAALIAGSAAWYARRRV